MSLTLQRVSKSFNELAILNDLSLELSTGEILAIVGESGSGKSTLLSLIAGFERPTSGELIFEQKATGPWKDDQWADFRKQSLGFVFQNYHLIPYLTAEENVALPLRLLGRAKPLEAARDLLFVLGLAKRASHLPNQMSGGERQRVAIARALVHKPSLILADEPTGSLDVQTGEQVLNVLFEILKTRRQTALIVTHSLEVAARCDRILKLKNGQLWSA